MKRLSLGLALLWIAASPGFSQYYFDYPTFKRFEFGLHLGLTKPDVIGGTVYEDTWSAYQLTSVYERTLITPNQGWTASPEVFMQWNLSPAMGVRVSLGRLSSQIPTTSDFEMTWSWADGRHIQQTIAWTGSGRITTIPLGLNLVARKVNDVNTWYVTAGVMISWNTFSADSSFGFGVTNTPDDSGVQYVDGLRIPLRVPDTAWRSLGANIGVGKTFALSDSLSLGADISYFLFPKKEFSWSFVYGNYDGVFYHELKNQRFAPEDGDYILNGDKISKFNVSLTRLRVGLVLVLSLGPTRI
jgi:hypothetical protein